MNPLTPSPALLCKLGSLIVHADEAHGLDGHMFDWTAFNALLVDPEVREWIEHMEMLAMVPVKRNKGAGK